MVESAFESGEDCRDLGVLHDGLSPSWAVLEEEVLKPIAIGVLCGLAPGGVPVVKKLQQLLLLVALELCVGVRLRGEQYQLFCQLQSEHLQGDGVLQTRKLVGLQEPQQPAWGCFLVVEDRQRSLVFAKTSQ